MTILKGKNILDKVRRKIKDEDYASYDEINEAQSEIAKRAPFNWLRKSNILGSGLTSETKEYDLSLGSVRRITALWVSDASTTDLTNPITGITLTGTNPVVITIVSHGLTTGRQVVFSSIAGTTELNDNTYKITSTGTNTFTLDDTVASSFTAWTSGGTCSVWDIDDSGWDLMVEEPPELFEATVKYNTYTTTGVSTGTVITSTNSVITQRSADQFSYMVKSGTSNPFMTIAVSPTPDQTYKIKVDYIKEVTEISEDVVPDIPVSYVDSLVNMAASFILMRSADPNNVRLASDYRNIAERQMLGLVCDSHPNRAGSIDRPKAIWIY